MNPQTKKTLIFFFPFCYKETYVFQECAITTFNKYHVVHSYSCIHILCSHIDSDVIKVRLNKMENTFIHAFLSQ